MHDYAHLRLHHFRTRRAADHRHTRPAPRSAPDPDVAERPARGAGTAPPVMDLTEPTPAPVAGAGRTMRS